MRPSAIVPILLSLAALVLSFLCLFAGSKTTFLPDFPVITLNTSEIGQNVLNTSSTLTSIINNVDPGLKSQLSDAVEDVARKLGLQDFYSANIMTYCEGYYTPTPVANATVKKSDIHKNFTLCSNRTAFFQFDPRDILQTQLNSSGLSDISLDDLDWPADIDRGITALHVAQKAAFILYCIGIGFIALATVFALLSFFLSGRLSAFLNVILSALAFLAIGIASAIVTVIAVKGASLINKYGKEISVSASSGGKFMALTWAATAAMVLCSMWWCFDCIVGRRNHSRSRNHNAEKYDQGY